MLLSKAEYFADQVPPSIVDIIDQSSLPKDESQLTAWNDKFGYGKYHNSCFFKGNLSTAQDRICKEYRYHCGYISLQTMKKRLKSVLLDTFRAPVILRNGSLLP